MAVSLVVVVMLLIACCVLNVVTSDAATITSNVSASCSTKTVKTGDEVRIEVCTRKMTVSTFVASVEYDPQKMTYKGYEGTDGGQSVYLVNDKDESVLFDVTVESSKVDPVVGMYAIGTTDKKYRASNPLVTLVFQAMDDGDVDYSLTESSDGKDSYTSSELGQEIQAETSEDDSTLIYVGIGVIAVLVCLTIAFICKRKERKDEK